MPKRQLCVCLAVYSNYICECINVCMCVCEHASQRVCVCVLYVRVLVCACVRV